MVSGISFYLGVNLFFSDECSLCYQRFSNTVRSCCVEMLCLPLCSVTIIMVRSDTAWCKRIQGSRGNPLPLRYDPRYVPPAAFLLMLVVVPVDAPGANPRFSPTE